MAVKQELPPPAEPGDVALRDGKAFGPGGVSFGKQFKLGLFNVGRTTIADFVARRPDLLAGRAASLLRVMSAVSANEGALEAVNTWDNAFLTFGCFQWTAGADAGAGELAFVLHRLRQSAPDAFEEYFGRHGLGVVGEPKPRAWGVATGFLSVGGRTLDSPGEKAELRQPIWFYRFWRAGHDDAVRACQIACAMDRIDVFYRHPHGKLGGRSVADYVTSEYGVALLLDQHVNRPGHVPGTLADALADVGGGDPLAWDDAQERALIDRYVSRRADTSMTDSSKRAAKVTTAVAAGTLSDRRGSFVGNGP